MGTTRDALLAGSTSFVWVVAIEGFERLLTNGDPAAAVTAWAGSDWTAASSGLFVQVTVDQGLDPDEPLIKLGSCILEVVATPGDDALGVAVARKTSPAETYLDETLDNDDTTAVVKSTALFDESGAFHVGTECIGYSGKTGTTFTGLTRGLYSPFGSHADYLANYATRNFSHHHRVGTNANQVRLTPLVTSTQRVWIGRWVGVFAHRKDASGVLDVRSEAELVFAGRISAAFDDKETFATVIQVKGVTEVFADAIVGGSAWEGFGEDGTYLVTGQTFGMVDVDGGAVAKTATALTVVAGTPTSANEIQEDTYTLATLCSALSTWLASEKAAGRLNGDYSMASPVSIPGGELRTKIYWSLTGGLVSFALSTPRSVAEFLGFPLAEVDPTNASNVVARFQGAGGTQQHWHQGTEPQRIAIVLDGTGSATGTFSTKSGAIFDQLATLPVALKPVLSLLGVGEWGLFVLGDSQMVVASFVDNADGTVTLSHMAPAFKRAAFIGLGERTIVKLAASSNDVLSIRQIFAFETDPVLLLVTLAIATPTSGYNNPLLPFPPSCGAQIPYELVDGMIDSITALASMGGSMAVILEKPTRMSELIRSDLVFRWVFLLWRNGGMEMASWKTPTASLAIATLDEGNKASPSGHKENLRASTSETTEWLRQVVAIRYNRDATDPRSDSYKRTVQFEDSTAVEDAGGAVKGAQVSLRNTYSEFAGTGKSVESLLDEHMAMMPLISRPARRVQRALSPSMFLAVAPGDVVFLTDNFARDPETGLRGVVNRPALITRARYSWGGKIAGSNKPEPAIGGVEAFFTDVNPDRIGATYVPAGMINDLYSIDSFDHGYDAAAKKLKLLTNRFTETTDGQGNDASFLNPNDEIIIIERDPADPDDPVYWERKVASGATAVVGDEVEITEALSSPAWDNTKQYYLISRKYSDATLSQHVHVYQADDADGRIQDTALPYLYGSGGADATFTTNAGMAARYPFSFTDAIEMPPTLVRVDGAGRDVAFEAALIRLLNNGIDYKSAIQCPMLGAVTSNTSYSSGSGYLLVDYFPIYLTNEILSNAVFRHLTVALWAYSTDGTETKARVTLSRERPSFPTTQDVAWAGTYAQVEWTGLTSTTPGTLADRILTANVKDPLTGEAWVAVELGFKCASRGLAKFTEGARQTA